ncbi:MAG: hypothetical protein MI923_15640 [Phycisphaerales bacterium]|nr:hypothetical protein [Phycisphaerales bacterium]
MRMLPHIVKASYLVVTIGGLIAASIWEYSLGIKPISIMLLWAIAIPGILAILLTWNYPKKISKPANACYFCGYDLTGLVENRCPECGRYFIPPAHDDGEE